MSSSVAVTPAVDDPPASGPRRGIRPLVLVAVLLAVAPFLLSAVDVLLHHRGIALGGDQAVLELATREAAAGSRSVGAYSRYGWSHPGPLWFYTLAPVYRLLGSTSTGLYLAVLAVHASFAAILVLVVARTWGAARALAAATGVVATWAVLGPAVFLAIWNPYALVLPTVLLLVLAALAATGRPVALAGTALTGTFLVQTHIGTAVLVAAVGACAALGTVVGLARRRQASPGRPWAAVGLWVLTGLAWLPPLLQELRPGTGNLTLLRAFQAIPHDGHGLAESAAAVGSELLVLPTLGRAPVLPQSAAALGTAEVAGLAVALVVAVLAPIVLAGLALRAGRRVTAALAALSLVALAAALVSATQVEGTLYPYLVVWMAVLPLGPALCAVDLVLVAVSRRWPRLPRPVRLGSAGALPVLALAAAVVVLAGAPPVAAESRFGDAALASEVLGALGPPGAGAVRVRIATSDSWPAAAGLVLALARAGYDPRVTQDWTFMFGPERGATGRETREVVLFSEPARPALAGLPGARELPPVSSSLGTTYVLLRDPPGDAVVPALPGPITGKAPS